MSVDKSSEAMQAQEDIDRMVAEAKRAAHDPDDPLHVLLDCANAACHGDKRAAARMRALARERDPARLRELAAQIRRYMREDEGA